MTKLEKIKHLEYYFPKTFADIEDHDFGVMFYNTANPDSNDSNHAIITDGSDYEKALEKIKAFYLSKNLGPRVYSALEDGQLEKISLSGRYSNDYLETGRMAYIGGTLYAVTHGQISAYGLDTYERLATLAT